jgi:hypothetical protein
MPPATTSATAAPASAAATGMHPARDPPWSARAALRLMAQLPAQLTSTHPGQRGRDLSGSPVGTGNLMSSLFGPLAKR